MALGIAYPKAPRTNEAGNQPGELLNFRLRSDAYIQAS
ncbi:hypothetical protein SAMCCGM7_pC0685 (plasmid) [Sinorhizobium americanum CCGM7]|nr:hypothetical protein SAMCCGM7_pC0685 [Sinorhizobium americanum CCGM7]